jgi:cell division protease FtsH
VTMQDFEAAKDKIMMGAERRSMVMTAAQKEMTAYHEAGHALVGMLLPKCDPVYKATIIPRGGALGMVMSLPEMDRLNMFKDECHQRLAMTMAGKAAEIHKYGPDSVSNGPAGDIMQASALARAMVLQWGMSDKVGNIDYSEAAQGYQGSTGGFSVSASTKELVEKEVQEFIQDGSEWAMKIITENNDKFENLAQGLLEYETLTGDEIKRVMDGLPPVDDSDKDGPDEGDKPSLTSIPKAKGKAKKSTPDAGGMEPEPSA